MGERHEDRDLHDEQLEADIELLAEVIDRASGHVGHLTSDEVDRALGVVVSISTEPAGAQEPVEQEPADEHAAPGRLRV